MENFRSTWEIFLQDFLKIQKQTFIKLLVVNSYQYECCHKNYHYVNDWHLYISYSRNFFLCRYNTELVFGTKVTLPLTKAERLSCGSSLMDHAMVLSALSEKASHRKYTSHFFYTVINNHPLPFTRTDEIYFEDMFLLHASLVLHVWSCL